LGGLAWAYFSVSRLPESAGLVLLPLALAAIGVALVVYRRQ